MPGIQTQSFDPARRDFSPYGLSCVYWQPSLMPRPDQHNEIEVNFLQEGSVTYLLGGKKVTLKPGTLSLFWAAIPHQIVHFNGEKPYFVATIPLHTFLQWQLPQNFSQMLMQGNMLMEGDSSREPSDLHFFKQWVSDLAVPRAGISRPVCLEMEARIIRMALDYTDSLSKGSARSPLVGLAEPGLSKVEQMASFIAQNYMHRLTVEQISQTVKLHPSYAMNLFQKTFGTTLVNFLTQHRIAHAQRLLATTKTQITHIALQSGFSSISRFNEAFQRQCGCSPREYRKGHES